MISMVTYDRNIEEMKILKVMSKDIAADLSEEQWIMEQFSDLTQLCSYIEDIPLMDLLMYDVTEKEALVYLQEIRKQYQLSHIMLLADVTVSPMDYMKPSIRANSLLLRPFTKQQATEVIHDFIKDYFRKIEREKREGINSYIIESKEGTLTIPYEQIYFFEAREKKIFVCTGKEEFGFYYTIDKLVEELPDQFIRCHRGFIVNSEKIRRIALSQNTIYLADEFDVPLSRSYKSVLKGLGR